MNQTPVSIRDLPDDVAGYQRWRCIGPWILVCLGAAGAGGWVLGTQTEVGQFFRDLGLSLGDSTANLVAETITWWMGASEMHVADCRDPSSEECVTATGAIGQLQQHTTWLVVAVAIGSLLFVAIRLALRRDGRSFADAGVNFLIFVLVTGLGVGVVELLLRLGDGYSEWIIAQTSVSSSEEELGEDLGQNVIDTTETVMDDDDDSEHGGWTTLTVFVLFFGLLASLIQFVVMAGRAAALVLIVGLLPVAAAAGLTEGGRNMRQKYFSWLIALVLYKPAAATIWAAAFFLLDDDDLEGIFGLMTLVAMMILALFALPALMRLIAPAVSSASSSGGGGGGGLAAAGMLATGAVQMASSRGGGGAAAASGGKSPAPSGSTPGGSAPKKNANTSPSPKGSSSSSGGVQPTKQGAVSPQGQHSPGGGAVQVASMVQQGKAGLDRSVEADEPSGADDNKPGGAR